MISALQALQDHRYVYFGFQSHPTDKDPWQATTMMAYSDNLVSWKTIGEVDGTQSLRDGFVKKIGDDYYIIGTGAFYKTSDFIEFQSLDYIPNKSNFKTLWAPEIFQDLSGKYHIVYCAGDSDQGVLNDYIADFDPTTDTISNVEQTISFRTDAIDNSYKIDPDIFVHDGVYYLAIGGNYIFSSDNYLGPYQKFPVNFAPAPQKYNNHNSGIAGWVEGPELFLDGNAVRLFADQTDGNGLVFRSSTSDNIMEWTELTKTRAPFKMRHGSIIVNDKITAEVDVDESTVPQFDQRVLIQGLHAKQKVPMTCFMRDSFQVQYEDNSTNEIQFVAYDDGSPSFNYIAVESTVTFNNEPYVIKNVEEDENGIGLYTVTAIHFVNSEIGRVFQHNVRNGVLTYTIQDVLNYFLNDSTANPFGFSYHVYGDFDKQQIENLGNASGKDMIQKITDTWPGTIIYPVGLRLDVYSADAFKKNLGKRITYIHDTSDIKLTEDSTNITNQVRVIGAQKETQDNSTDASTPSINIEDNNGDSTPDFDISGDDITIKRSGSSTDTFVADAKKYLGVPYVWGGAGGARGGNPFDGMDCSSFVSQVYQDFGIHIPAQTIAMEPSFHEIPYSEAGAGDVGFYGPHGGTHHICLLLDHNTQIYEPEPGESCKVASISSFPPDWYARNDAMHSKIAQPSEITISDDLDDSELIKPDTMTLSISGSNDATDGNAKVEYYFEPFVISLPHSIEEWGLHPMADIQDDRFKYADAMRKYASKQLQPDPSITVEITMHSNEMPIAGEVRKLTIPDRDTILGRQGTQRSYSTDVTVVAYTWYPFNKSQGTDVTYDNVPATLLSLSSPKRQLASLRTLMNRNMDRIPQVYYSKDDPSQTENVRNGAIWIKPIESHVTDDDKGGETNNAGKQSSLRQNETRSDG